MEGVTKRELFLEGGGREQRRSLVFVATWRAASRHIDRRAGRMRTPLFVAAWRAASRYINRHVALDIRTTAIYASLSKRKP